MRIIRSMDNQKRPDLVEDLERFSREVGYVYEKAVFPTWHDRSGLHGLSNTLYGYVMGVFARIDLFSQYWKGTMADEGQADRMRDFMVKYVGYDKEPSYVSVQIWRHALMHTSRPRFWTNKRNGITYKYLIQWGEQHLPKNRHFTIDGSGSSRKLRIGLLFLIEDLKSGVSRYLNEVDTSTELGARFDTVQKRITVE